jgi:tRNA A37 threonylcarbamoyladenosine synthetase subunit TsaC/SUA5/YrdC
LETLGEPLLSMTLSLSNETEPLHEAWEIRDRLEHQLDLVIDAGVCSEAPTTVIDLTDEIPKLLRQGGGDLAPFGL